MYKSKIKKKSETNTLRIQKATKARLEIKKKTKKKKKWSQIKIHTFPFLIFKTQRPYFQNL